MQDGQGVLNKVAISTAQAYVRKHCNCSFARGAQGGTGFICADDIFIKCSGFKPTKLDEVMCILQHEGIFMPVWSFTHVSAALHLSYFLVSSLHSPFMLGRSNKPVWFYVAS